MKVDWVLSVPEVEVVEAAADGEVPETADPETADKVEAVDVAVSGEAAVAVEVEVEVEVETPGAVVDDAVAVLSVDTAVVEEAEVAGCESVPMSASWSAVAAL